MNCTYAVRVVGMNCTYAVWVVGMNCTYAVRVVGGVRADVHHLAAGADPGGEAGARVHEQRRGVAERHAAIVDLVLRNEHVLRQARRCLWICGNKYRHAG